MRKLIILSLLFSLVSCSSGKKVSDEMTNTEAITKKEIYRFSVSFYSIGTGANVEAKESFLDFIDEFEKLLRVDLAYETTNWGREGETDYCFKLKELNDDNQMVFIQESKDRLSKADHVRLWKMSRVNRDRKNIILIDEGILVLLRCLFASDKHYHLDMFELPKTNFIESSIFTDLVQLYLNSSGGQ